MTETKKYYLLVKEIPNWGGGAMSRKSPMMKSGIHLQTEM